MSLCSRLISISPANMDGISQDMAKMEEALPAFSNGVICLCLLLRREYPWRSVLLYIRMFTFATYLLGNNSFIWLNYSQWYSCVDNGQRGNWRLHNEYERWKRFELPPTSKPSCLAINFSFFFLFGLGLYLSGWLLLTAALCPYRALSTYYGFPWRMLSDGASFFSPRLSSTWGL